MTSKAQIIIIIIIIICYYDCYHFVIIIIIIIIITIIIIIITIIVLPKPCTIVTRAVHFARIYLTDSQTKKTKIGFDPIWHWG